MGDWWLVGQWSLLSPELSLLNEITECIRVFHILAMYLYELDRIIVLDGFNNWRNVPGKQS